MLMKNILIIFIIFIIVFLDKIINKYYNLFKNIIFRFLYLFITLFILNYDKTIGLLLMFAFGQIIIYSKIENFGYSTTYDTTNSYDLYINKCNTNDDCYSGICNNNQCIISTNNTMSSKSYYSEITNASECKSGISYFDTKYNK